MFKCVQTSSESLRLELRFKSPGIAGVMLDMTHTL